VKKHEVIAMAFAAASQSAAYDKGRTVFQWRPEWIALGTDVAAENLPPMAEFLFGYAARGNYPGEALYNVQVTRLGLKAPLFYTLPVDEQVPWLIFEAAIAKLLPFIDKEAKPEPDALMGHSDDPLSPFGNALAKQDYMMKREPFVTRMKEVQDETAQQEATEATQSSPAQSGEAHGAPDTKKKRKIND
jgi:hypothetical protein